ncbi:SGNH/GDSL hydrolase family protein [Sphingobium sp. YC-XJ3]|uniref:SGNH/GDSL hydrolase family protein n=1 Tax=Sphingobium sp. YC-XJ3 TaxID=3024245 RepID=UPI00236274CE|nr:SGNH/GDSL hydrolase family protein [Sphingobium sp. YC-XJ3]WDA36404.1 SGNH/GDSL hydrolase family protein [Sphingobium sp. YC-XJ3]WDA37861.1 SGNH/GDSL hydrolase family protein [Sphingobium sp. YC-XJ3]
MPDLGPNVGGGTSTDGVRRAVASMAARTPYNSQVAVLGDSIAYGNGFASSPTNVKLYAKGYINWAAYLGRQRWTFDNADNFGVPGNNTNDVLRRTPFAIASTTASVVIVDCLTNDGPNGVSLEQSYANYSAIVNAILDAEKIAVLITPRPRDITASGLTMTAAQYRAHLARRDYVLGLHNPGLGIYAVDMWRYLADPASANGAMKSGFTYDGLHPGVTGGYWGGVALAELFGTGRAPGLFPFKDVLVAQNTDVFNADYPRGCVNSNPMMQGGASAATGYTVSGGSGVTATGSKVSPTGGRTDIQQIVLGGTASANADIYDFYQTISAGNLAVGDVVEAYAEVEYDSLSGLTSHGLVLVDTTAFTNITGHLIDSTDINAMPFTLPAAVSGVMRAPRLTLQNTTLRAGMKGRSINGQAVSGTYRVGAMAVRKVA